MMLLALALGAAACGDDDGSASPSQTTAAAPAAGDGAGAGAGTSLDTLGYALGVGLGESMKEYKVDGTTLRVLVTEASTDFTMHCPIISASAGALTLPEGAKVFVVFSDGVEEDCEV